MTIDVVVTNLILQRKILIFYAIVVTKTITINRNYIMNLNMEFVKRKSIIKFIDANTS